jgi:hypothetical protein
MPMPAYPVLCYTSGCGLPGIYKIAARWSDGVTAELKTYALCCSDCLATWFAKSRQRQSTCRRAPGETLDPPGIYQWSRGKRDRELERRHDLEEQLIGSANA